MSFSIEVNSRHLEAALRKAPAITKSRLQTWVAETTANVEEEAKRDLGANVSRGASGETINSIIPKFKLSNLEAEVKPRKKHAIWVHEGRGPGKMPPISAIEPWAKRMGLNPFMVARAIGKNGTKGHPFMDNAYRAIKPKAERDARTTLNQIVSAL